MKYKKDKLEYLSNNNNNIKFLNMCAKGQTIDGQKFSEKFLNLKFKQYTKAVISYILLMILKTLKNGLKFFLNI